MYSLRSRGKGHHRTRPDGFRKDGCFRTTDPPSSLGGASGIVRCSSCSNSVRSFFPLSPCAHLLLPFMHMHDYSPSSRCQLLTVSSRIRLPINSQLSVQESEFESQPSLEEWTRWHNKSHSPKSLTSSLRLLVDCKTTSRTRKGSRSRV